MLTRRQNGVCSRLYTSVRKKENIDKIVREVKEDDFLTIFIAIDGRSQERLLGSVESVLPEQIKAVLNRVKELNLLEETLKAEILSSKDGDKVRYISPIECTTVYNSNLSPEFLGVILEFSELVLKNKKCVVTEESIQIDNTEDKEDLSETSSLASDESTINSESNSATDTAPQSDPIKPMCKATLDMGNESESSSPTSKAIVVGGIGGTIAALAVIGGCFAFGVQLPMLANWYSCGCCFGSRDCCWRYYICNIRA